MHEAGGPGPRRIAMPERKPRQFPVDEDKAVLDPAQMVA